MRACARCWRALTTPCSPRCDLFPQVSDRSLTGTVVDSGDGVTHVIPVVCWLVLACVRAPSFAKLCCRFLPYQAEGYVIGSCIKHIPLAGRDMTDFIQKQLRERGEPIPPEDSLQVAKKVKEDYWYAVAVPLCT